jgi:hypothetical protein
MEPNKINPDTIQWFNGPEVFEGGMREANGASEITLVM